MLAAPFAKNSNALSSEIAETIEVGLIVPLKDRPSLHRSLDSYRTAL